MFIIQYWNKNIGSVLLDIKEGKPKAIWKNKNMWSEISSPVIIDGYIYVCHGGPDTLLGSLCCVDSANGKMMWEERLKEKPISLTAADRKLIVLDAKGTLYIAEATPSAYSEISSVTIPNQKGFELWWTPPVLCGGRIYCRSTFGDLVCIDVSK
jgi:outer membrane protein assembly factor BamB